MLRVHIVHQHTLENIGGPRNNSRNFLFNNLYYSTTLALPKDTKITFYFLVIWAQEGCTKINNVDLREAPPSRF